jgi:hypothetical protein
VRRENRASLAWPRRGVNGFAWAGPFDDGWLRDRVIEHFTDAVACIGWALTLCGTLYLIRPVVRLMYSVLYGRLAAAVLTVLMAGLIPHHATAADYAGTIYAARITSANAWHDLVTQPAASEFVDAYLAVAAVSAALGGDRDNRLGWDVEGQVAYNFGDQSHWEFNLAAGPRWKSFPWNDVISTTAAFRVGLSMASEVPAVEVALEDASEQLLIYWVVELTLTPPTSGWGLSLRLHHRSPAFGLLGDAGGMNALGVGLRRTF